VKKRIGYRGDTEAKAVVAGTKRIRGGAPVAEGFENLGDGVHLAPAAEPDSSLGPDAWFSEDPAGVADLEKALLSEWFDKSQPHLTPALYVTTRNKIIELYKENKCVQLRRVARMRKRTTAAAAQWFLGSLAQKNDFSFLPSGSLARSRRRTTAACARKWAR
jgi:hypothetical protein